MKRIIFISLYIAPTFIVAQWSDNGNYIRNNSFEEVSSDWVDVCSVDEVEDGQLDPSFCSNGLNEHQNSVAYWDEISYWGIPDQTWWVASAYVGTPDLYSTQFVDTPGAFPARSGDYWLSTAHEYVVIELEEELLPGNTYYLEVFVKKLKVGPWSISVYDEYPQH